jgi:uncharacterized RDD family membrane protein YckC
MAGHESSIERPYLLRRMAALFYDLLLNAALWMIMGFLALAFRGGAPVPAGSLWFQCLLLAVTGAFFMGFWHRDGQTAGMKAWRIQLVSGDGDQLTWKTVALRFLAACVSAGTGGLGFLWALVDADGLTWHDRFAGTRIRLLPKRS